MSPNPQPCRSKQPTLILKDKHYNSNAESSAAHSEPPTINATTAYELLDRPVSEVGRELLERRRRLEALATVDRPRTLHPEPPTFKQQTRTLIAEPRSRQHEHSTLNALCISLRPLRSFSLAAPPALSCLDIPVCEVGSELLERRRGLEALRM